MSRLSFFKYKIIRNCIFIFFTFIFCIQLSSCTKYNFVKLSKSSYVEKQKELQKENKQNKNNEKNIKDKTEQKQDNILSTTEEELDINNTVIVKDSATEIVEEKLAKPFTTLNVAVIAPVSGKYESIGSSIVESAMLYSADAKYQNTMNINIYNIGKLSGKNWKEQEEVKRLINDGNDIIIGSVFADATEKLLSVLPNDVIFISFLNDAKFDSKYPNVIISSVDDSFRFLSLFEYLNDNNRKFLSLLLPTTKAGYNVDKIIRRLAKDNGITIMNSQFYQPKNQQSISTAIRNTKNTLSATYMVDENGNLITENIKNKKKNKSANQNTSENYEKVVVQTNGIYIEGNEEDLNEIISNLDKEGIIDKDIQLFSNAIVDFDKSIINNLEQIKFIGYNYNAISHFNDEFKNKFSHLPNYFAYMTYDTLAMVNYLSNETNLKPSDIYGDDGFRGILDEFRFARTGHIERRMSIYELTNGNLMLKYTPDYYYRINGLRVPTEQTYIQDDYVDSKSV